jgi:hypothetical protein
MPRSLSRLAAIACAVAATVAEAGAFPIRVPDSPVPVQADLEGKLEFLDVERIDSSSPYQNPQVKLRLHLTTDFSPRLRFVTGLTGTAGGTPHNANGAGVYDFGHVLQEISPSLEFGEAYLDFHSSAVDLRAGLQKFAWGKLDTLQPNDLLNPQTFYDPLLEDETDRKIGIPALAPTLYLPSVESPFLPEEPRLTFVWEPIYVPYFFPDQNERWYPPIARAPSESQVMGVTVQNQSSFHNAPVPARTFDNGTYAVRAAGRLGRADLALYYFDGFDTSPALDTSALGFAQLDPLSPQLVDVRSEVEVFPVFQRIQAAGADLAWRLYEATLRLEGAYVFDRLYTRNISDIIATEQIGPIDQAALLTGRQIEVPVTLSPANVRRNGVQWGAGGDTFIGDTFVLLQANQTIVLNNDVNLLISDYETRFSMTIRRGFLDDRLTAELKGLYGMQGVYGIAHPRLTYSVNDHLDVRIGYLAIEGHENSLIGQYKHNDEAYVRARLLF